MFEDVWKVYKKVYSSVSGIVRIVWGLSMLVNFGKVQILGVNEIKGEEVFVLRFIQGRNLDWVGRFFFVKFDLDVIWLFDLEFVLDNEQFFFENIM